jgi:hypothetical protein
MSVTVLARELVALMQDKFGIFVDNLLHSIGDELVVGFELLANEAFLIEEARDDSPAVFLGDLVVELLVFFIDIRFIFFTFIAFINIRTGVVCRITKHASPCQLQSPRVQLITARNQTVELN